MPLRLSNKVLRAIKKTSASIFLCSMLVAFQPLSTLGTMQTRIHQITGIPVELAHPSLRSLIRKNDKHGRGVGAKPTSMCVTRVFYRDLDLFLALKLT